MRFPLHHKRLDSETGNIRYDSLSTALTEALRERNAIRPISADHSPPYFYLPIEEGPVLSLLSQFYELDGEFHVGCSSDHRPPSFIFHHQVRDSERNGEWYVGYRRELKLGVFQQRDFFHKPAVSLYFKTGEKVRDLDTLAEAYNSPSNYEESLTIIWSGRGVGRDGSPSGYVNLRLSADFNEGKMTTLNLVDLLCGTSVLGSQSNSESNLFLSSAKDLPLSRIASEYHSKQGEMRQHSVEEVLATIGYSPAEVLLGVLQVAERVIPPQKGITLDLSLCEKAMG